MKAINSAVLPVGDTSEEGRNIMNPNEHNRLAPDADDNPLGHLPKVPSDPRVATSNWFRRMPTGGTVYERTLTSVLLQEGRTRGA